MLRDDVEAHISRNVSLPRPAAVRAHQPAYGIRKAPYLRPAKDHSLRRFSC